MKSLKVIAVLIIIVVVGISAGKPVVSQLHHRFNYHDYVVKRAVLEMWPNAHISQITHNSLCVNRYGRTYRLGYRFENGVVVFRLSKSNHRPVPDFQEYTY
jgi:hypothetical protein